ncbi:hypothetical protein [Pedobacter sp. Leaf170]|uniref:hypothetical protein n=1 Tax=Pedobacter sp. Leaf170 TaxID=2876558 RepID=UPI001E28D62C|nr:hypothetical protein [Pedobacter sp. Leaf170]
MGNGVINSLEDLGSLEVRAQVYGQIPEPDNMSEVQKTEILCKIRSILLNPDPHFNHFDRSVVQNEEIIKVFLGIDLTPKEIAISYYDKAVKARLTTPMMELVGQMNIVPSTERNRSLLRNTYALLLNGRSKELNELLIKNFPEYYHHIREV